MSTATCATTPLISARSTFAPFDSFFVQTSSEELPVTSTLRLLEVSLGLTQEQAERLLSREAVSATPSEVVSQPPVSRYQRFAPIVCSFVLTVCVATLLVAFS